MKVREILFRGKRKDNGEWVYGYYTKVTEHYCDASNFNKKLGDYIITNLNEMVEVIPETVSQYTGLNDTKDNKIYDGDILRHREHTENGDIDSYDYVYFHETYGTFEIGLNLRKVFHEVLGFYINSISRDTDYEVIGNIFDNKELLDRENK